MEAAAVRMESSVEAERVPLVSPLPLVSILRPCRLQRRKADGLHVFSRWPALLFWLSRSTATNLASDLGKDKGIWCAMNGQGSVLQVHEGVEESVEASTTAVEQGARGAALDSAHFWDFIRDGLNMLVRSATLQVTFSDTCRCMLALIFPSHS